MPGAADPVLSDEERRRSGAVLVPSKMPSPKLAVAERSVGGGDRGAASARLMAATSSERRPTTASISPLSHSSSTRTSNSDSFLPEGRDSMCTTFTPSSWKKGRLASLGGGDEGTPLFPSATNTAKFARATRSPLKIELSDSDVKFARCRVSKKLN